MADYYNFQQVVQMCGIAESTLEQLQSKGLLEPTVKRGRPFLSLQQVYRLRIAVHQASERKNRFAGSPRKSRRTLARPDHGA